jgi:hypothetical protein
MTKGKKQVTSEKSTKPSKVNVVEAFIKESNHLLKPVLLALREIISKAEPSLTEQIKWNAPSFCHKGDDRITFHLGKKDCVLIIWHRGAKSKDRKGRGPLLEDDSGLLQWQSPDRALSKFSSVREVEQNKSVLTKLVKRWISATKV